MMEDRDDSISNKDASDDPDVSTFWRCCQNLQQRYVFILLSMIASMFHTVMSLSINVAIVAMVKEDYASNVSNNNVTDTLNTCPVEVSDTDLSNSNDLTTKAGHFDWDEVTQGYILTATNFGSVFSGLIGARIAEIWSPKMIYGIVIVCSAICNLFMPIVANWNVGALIALRVIQGIFNGPVLAVHSILLSTWIPPQERTKLGGIYYSAEAIGMVLSMFLSGLLISAVNWEFVFYFNAGAVLLCSVFWFFLVYDNPLKHPGISPSERKHILDNVPKKTDVVYPVPWISILTSPPVWAHIAMQCGYMWTLYILLSEVPTYLSNVLHYNTQNTGLISALPMVSVFVGCILFSQLSQWLRHQKYLSHMGSYRALNAISTIGPAAALIGINQLGCDATSIIVLLVITSFLNSAFIGGSVYNLIDLGINFTGTTQGISWMASQIVSIISPNISASIINNSQTLSSWSVVFYISAGVAVCPYIIFLLFGSVDEQKWNKPLTKSNQKYEI